MKLLIFALTAFSSIAHANFDCVSRPDGLFHVKIESGVTPRMTVCSSERVFYSAVAVDETRDQNSDRFASRAFTNGNHAPASLDLNIYTLNGQLQGEFDETSYLPIVPTLELDCRAD